MPDSLKKLWKLGSVVIATPSMISEMKAWTPQQAARWRITPDELDHLKKTGFKQSESLAIVKNPALITDLPSIAAGIYASNYILKEEDYHKLEPYAGSHPVFAKLLSAKSRLTHQPGQKIPSTKIHSWIKGETQPYVSPDLDYEGLYSKLTTTQDTETLYLSAQLGWMHGCGKISLKDNQWHHYEDYVAMSRMTGLVPERLSPEPHGNGVCLDLDFLRFLQKNDLLYHRGRDAWVSIPDGTALNLYGENKNTFLAHALSPSMKIRYRIAPTLGLYFPSTPRAPNHESLMLSLLYDLEALPSQAFLSLDKSYLLQHLEDTGIHVEVSSDKEQYALFIYPPHGLGQDKGNNSIACTHLKNFFERVLPYSHYAPIDYDSIKGFQEKANVFGKTDSSGSPRRGFRTAMDDLGPLSFPELHKEDIPYQGERAPIYTPLWMKG